MLVRGSGTNRENMGLLGGYTMSVLTSVYVCIYTYIAQLQGHSESGLGGRYEVWGLEVSEADLTGYPGYLLVLSTPWKVGGEGGCVLAYYLRTYLQTYVQTCGSFV